MTERGRTESESTEDSIVQTNRQHSELMSEAGSWKVAGIVIIFAVGLLMVGALRFLDLRSEDPPAVAAYATLIYIGLTVLAAILLIRTGVPIRRLGFTMAVRPWMVIALALLGVALLQLSSWLLTPLWEQVFGSGRDLTRFSRWSNYWRSTGQSLRSARS